MDAILKRLLILLALCIPARAAITVVQHTSVDQATTGTTQSITVSSTASGSLLVVCTVIEGGSGITISSVTDNKSQTWVSGDSANNTAFGNAGGCWNFPNTVAAVTSVTITYSATTTASLFFYEFAGAATSSPVDVHNSASSQSTTTTPAAPSVTTTVCGDVVVEFLGYGNTGAISSISGGFTLDEQKQVSSGRAGGLARLITTSTGAQAPTWTLASTASFFAIAEAFKPAAACGSTPQMMLLGVGP